MLCKIHPPLAIQLACLWQLLLNQDSSLLKGVVSAIVSWRKLKAVTIGESCSLTMWCTSLDIWKGVQKDTHTETHLTPAVSHGPSPRKSLARPSPCLKFVFVQVRNSPLILLVNLGPLEWEGKINRKDFKRQIVWERGKQKRGEDVS